MIYSSIIPKKALFCTHPAPTLMSLNFVSHPKQNNSEFLNNIIDNKRLKIQSFLKITNRDAKKKKKILNSQEGSPKPEA